MSKPVKRRLLGCLFIVAACLALGCSGDGPTDDGQAANGTDANTDDDGAGQDDQAPQNSGATDPAAKKAALHAKLQGKWEGDREAYQQDNPGDATGDAVNTFLLYEFEDASMRYGTKFDRAANSADYEVVSAEGNSVTIEIKPLGDQPRRATITFVDDDHIKLILDGGDTNKPARLKRAEG
jgi:hypothetical protein